MLTWAEFKKEMEKQRRYGWYGN